MQSIGKQHILPLEDYFSLKNMEQSVNDIKTEKTLEINIEPNTVNTNVTSTETPKENLVKCNSKVTNNFMFNVTMFYINKTGENNSCQDSDYKIRICLEHMINRQKFDIELDSSQISLISHKSGLHRSVSDFYTIVSNSLDRVNNQDIVFNHNVINRTLNLTFTWSIRKNTDLLTGKDNYDLFKYHVDMKYQEQDESIMCAKIYQDIIEENKSIISNIRYLESPDVLSIIRINQRATENHFQTIIDEMRENFQNQIQELKDKNVALINQIERIEEEISHDLFVDLDD